MNESTLTQNVLSFLKVHKFKVLKLSDRFTVGIPDSAICKDHKTTWAEFKVYQVSTAPIETLRFNFKDYISPREKAQLAHMVQLEAQAYAIYIIFLIMTPNDDYQMFIVSPSQIHYSVENDAEIFLGPPRSLHDLQRTL